MWEHIYVEKGIKNHPRTKKILAQNPDASIIYISHYKDVFCRSHQNFKAQHQHQQLILAEKREHFLYQGAPVCQNFGNDYFYYTSCMMNCMFDCEYCYLKGMYSSGNVVIFVNIEDYFRTIEEVLKQHPVYLCISYDTDLAAFEKNTGYVKAWLEFARKQENLYLELRTKTANTKLWENLEGTEHMIVAFTLSPEEIIKKYEHHTPTLKQRLDCAKLAAQKGFPVRLCFDPMIYIPGWEAVYQNMFLQVEKEMSETKVKDVSIGTFRVSQDYMKNMRKQGSDCSVLQYPYSNREGVYGYDTQLEQQMLQLAEREIRKWMPPEQIFRWN